MLIYHNLTIPPIKMTTLASRGWKIGFHQKMTTFRGVVYLPTRRANPEYEAMAQWNN